MTQRLPDSIANGEIIVQQFAGDTLPWMTTFEDLNERSSLDIGGIAIVAAQGLIEVLDYAPYGKHHHMVDVGIKARFAGMDESRGKPVEKMFTVVKQPRHGSVIVDAHNCFRSQEDSVFVFSQGGQGERRPVQVAISALERVILGEKLRNKQAVIPTEASMSKPDDTVPERTGLLQWLRVRHI